MIVPVLLVAAWLASGVVAVAVCVIGGRADDLSERRDDDDAAAHEFPLA
jgi:hypothetical protein